MSKKIEFDFDWGYDIKWAWRFARQFQFKRVFRQLFAVACPIASDRPGIFIAAFGFTFYYHFRG